jgi:UDP-N-acetylmuramoyl-L-alanyl-D-glutamate--2,6-diaminopimelate ligase
MARMSLSQLLTVLPGARQLTPGDPGVARVVCDSRQVQPGDLFVAIAGTSADGHAFVATAVERGAVAVVVERLDTAPEGVPAVQVADGRVAVARLAHHLAGDPTSQLTVCGITGTNGKTTTAYLTRAIFETAGRRTGLLGTISYEMGDRKIAAATTTPGPVELAGYFADMLGQGCDAAVLEVSSHALDQRRTEAVHFRAAAFTNLTPEHLDYHKDMPSYQLAKGRLFEGLASDAVAVLNRDDEASSAFAKVTCATRVLWYSAAGQTDVWADAMALGPHGTRFRLHLPSGDGQVDLSLLGEHNVANALAAAGIAHGLGISVEHIVEGLQSLRTVPGRLDPVDCGQPFRVLVDFAHTDDALEHSLTSARSLAAGRVIAIFGCGGDRDRDKRPRMARVAEKFADVVIVTSDNPRNEASEAIADEVFTGFKSPAKVVRELDRAAAITRGIQSAGEGDVVVIAGKGHEPYQILGAERRHFDDREEARRALASLGYTDTEGQGTCS